MPLRRRICRQRKEGAHLRAFFCKRSSRSGAWRPPRADYGAPLLNLTYLLPFSLVEPPLSLGGAA